MELTIPWVFFPILLKEYWVLIRRAESIFQYLCLILSPHPAYTGKKGRINLNAALPDPEARGRAGTWPQCSVAKTAS